MNRYWKWSVAIIILLGGAGYYGYNRAMDYAADKISEQILPKEETANLLKNPEVQQLLKEQSVKAETGSASQPPTSRPTAPTDPASTTTASSAPTPKVNVTENKVQTLSFHSREEAMKFMLSKFTLSELKDFAAMASGGITPEEKAQIKQRLMSRLTPEEYQALKVYGLTEIQK